MRYQLLGPLEVIGEDGQTVALAGEKERVLLAVLVLGANRAVSADRLVDALWGEDPPATATNTLQVHVSKLRKRLAGAGAAPETLATTPGGYLLHAGADEVDATQFEESVRAATGDPGEVSARLGKALALWHGPALADVSVDALAGQRARLEELRLMASERRIEAELALGHHGEVIAELEALVRTEPLREGSRRQLMVALYRAGRQADALATFRQGREILAEELGVDPGPALQELELAILRQDAGLAAPTAETPTRSPPHSGTNLLNNLPSQLTSFIGRARELAELRDLVNEARMVMLAGAGGSGKTRLAIQVAAGLLDEVADGVWFVDLAPLTDPEMVTSAVAMVLGVREETNRPTSDTLVAALRSRRLLLVLDNCEHLIGPCAKLSETLLQGCPQVHIVATSREPLGIPGEQIYRVPPLSVPSLDQGEILPKAVLDSEAGQLFVERGVSHRPDFVLDEHSAAAVGSLCRRLDGLPLALELAAARLRSMSVADIEQRLDHRFRLLTKGGAQALSRQQTLRGLIDWSYDLLSDRERLVLGRLSVFAGGCDLRAAEAVCGGGDLQDYEVDDLLDSLMDKSLVQSDLANGLMRYRLLETVRQYAAERLGERDDEVAGVRCAHARFYLALAEEGAPHLQGKGQLEWLNRLDRDIENLRHALSHCLGSPGWGDECLRFGVALGWYWHIHNFSVEGVDLLREIVDRPDAQAPTALRAHALCTVGRLGVDLVPADARRWLEEGVALGRHLRSPALEADALHWLAEQAHWEGRVEEARDLAEKGYALACSVDNPRLRAMAIGMRTMAAPSPDPAVDRKAFADALGYCELAGDRFLASWIQSVLANKEMADGNLEAARTGFEASLRGDEEFGNEFDKANSLANLGMVSFLQGDLDDALSLLSESARLSVRHGNERDAGFALFVLALSVGAKGQDRDSAALHGASDAQFEKLGFARDEFESRLRGADHLRLRQAFGDEAFERDYERGRRLGLADAIALALRAAESEIGEPYDAAK